MPHAEEREAYMAALDGFLTRIEERIANGIAG
jgi:hypothetical protein